MILASITLILTFLRIPLGSPTPTLRATLGDPLLVHTLGISRVASYLRADDVSAVLKVTERAGVVFAIEIERERSSTTIGARDPYGVALGMTRATVAKLRGTPTIEAGNSWYFSEDADQTASFIYRFDGDVLESIKFIGSPANASGNASLPHVAEARGNSYANAVLDVSRTPAQSAHFVDRYLTVHECSPNDRSLRTERRDGRSYTVASASCGDHKMSIYFDDTRARP